MLKIRYKNNKYNSVWLVEPMITVGRSATNDLVVDDPYIADKHFEVHVTHETLTLKNLQPLKPVRVNMSEVIGTCTLKVDDEISLGTIELVVIDPKIESKASETANATQLRAVPSTGWALKANHTALANRVFPLKDTTVIGRAADCDISLAAAHLSRRHAQLQIIDGALFVKDLGSANGTFLNGKQVMEARVKRGDELRFDALTFGVMGPADEMAKTTVRTVPLVSVQAVRPAPAKPAPVPEKFAIQHNFAKKEPLPESTSTRGKSGLIFLGILAAVVIAAFIFKR
ncbi:MAG: FHA domain-containing protein [Gammaproteobacteria bacterium]|nr:MAG: FHA domain-containing protein [Gammaproteobacteria bacterium]